MFLHWLMLTLVVCQANIIHTSGNASSIGASCKEAEPRPSSDAVNASCIVYTSNSMCKDYIGNQLVIGNATVVGRRDAILLALRQYLTGLSFLGKKTSCFQAIFNNLCRSFYPACDITSSGIIAQRLCLESCNILFHSGICGDSMQSSLIGVTNSDEEGVVVMPEREKQLLYNMIRCGTFSPKASAHPDCYMSSYWKEFQNETSPTVSCYIGSGIGYLGEVNHTSSNDSCQRWHDQCPHRHIVASIYNTSAYDGNACRNPNGQRDRPWCYTDNSTIRWGYCDIRKCHPSDVVTDTGWSPWSSCSETCDLGRKSRSRNCSEYSAINNIGNCTAVGLNAQMQDCMIKTCSVDGPLGQWSAYGRCNVSCGEGYQLRYRVCSNLALSMDCTRLGESFELRTCLASNCTVPPEQRNGGLTAYEIAAVVVVSLLFAIFLIAVSRYCYKKKHPLPDPLEAEYSTFLTSQRICELQKLPMEDQFTERQFNSKDIVEKLIQEARIYENVSNYESVKEVLRQLYVDNFVQTSSGSFLISPSEKLRIRKVYEDWSCYYQKQNVGVHFEEENIDVEKHLTDWMSQCVEYSKLDAHQDPEESKYEFDNVVRLLFGAFDDRGNALYDRLSHACNRTTKILVHDTVFCSEAEDSDTESCT